MREVNKLDANFGAEVFGVDLSGDVTDETIRYLSNALYENQVLVIRNQRLDRDQYLSFGRRWGTPIPHVLDHMRMTDYPEMMTVGNTEQRDKEPQIRNGAALWHTDQSYEKNPASATMLYSIKNPEIGGETQFCNMRMAYESLDAKTKTKIAELRMKHKYGYGVLRPGELQVNPLLNDDQDNRVPPVLHPIVMPHPITATKSLYALGHGAYGIEDMDDESAHALIASLKEYVLDERFIYRHRYAVGDVVIWDTLQTMHSATPIEVPNRGSEERLLWRISVRDTPGIYQ